MSFEQFSLEPAESTAIRWEKWIKRFDLYLQARAITSDERKKALLLNCGGEGVFDVYETLKIQSNINYQTFTQLLSDYFAPKRNREYEVYVFRGLQQGKQQTIDSFHTLLKQKSKYCEFHDCDGEIKSQIIQKCSDNKVREKGLSESGITLEQLLLYARSREAVKLQAAMMDCSGQQSASAASKSDPEPTPGDNDITAGGQASPHTSSYTPPEDGVHKLRSKSALRYPSARNTNQQQHMQSPQPNYSSRSCGHCGGAWHTRGLQTCPAFNALCNGCGIVGHYQQMCRKSIYQHNNNNC